MKRSAPLKRTAWPRRAQPKGEQRPERFPPVVKPLERPPVYWQPANEPHIAAPKVVPVWDEAYRRLVAALPCIRCGVQGHSQAAHPNTGKGTGTKADDRDCFPLCADRPGVRGCHSFFDSGAAYTKEERRRIEKVWTRQTQECLRKAGAA